MTPLEAIEAHLTAELERRRWIPWSGPEYDEDAHPAPPDETDVLFFVQTGLGNRIEIGQTSKRCGTWGPSLATHWKPLPELPWSEKCPECDGVGVIQKRVAYSEVVDSQCEDCGGRGLAPGRSPAITAAEEALKLCREERKRVERLVGRLGAIEKILDDHTDYEGPMPETGDYVGGVDTGALDLIVDLLRPKGGR